MSTMYQKPEASTWPCEGHRCGATLSHKEEGAECLVCEKQVCDGCTYECAICGTALCLDHVIAHEVASEFRDCLYTCSKTTCLNQAGVSVEVAA